MNYYGKDVQTIVEMYMTDSDNGLDDKEAKKRLQKYGKNNIFDLRKAPKGKTILKLLYDPVSLLLLLSTLICISYASYSFALVIFSVWALNNIITIFSYYKAENILFTVKSYGIPKVKVKRGGKIYYIDSRLLVPGDLLIVEAGDIICSDCKIIKAKDLRVYEYDLCGTSDVQTKYVSEDVDSIHLSDMHGMLFASSSVVFGQAEAIVVACGENTEIVQTAGYIPISGKHHPEIFLNSKKLCRKLGMLTTFVTLMLLLVKLFVSPEGIFDSYLILVALMGASMTEALLPLSQTLAANEILHAAQSGTDNRVIIKNTGSIDPLRNISVFVASDDILDFENMDLLNSLSGKGVRAVICTSKEKAFEIATKYGASVCSRTTDIEYAKNTLAVYIADDANERSELIKTLKRQGETVGVLTTRLDCIRMLGEADVSFTYGKFKYKTNEYSKIKIESLSGKQNQILSRISDVICEENMLSTYRAVDCAKGIYNNIKTATYYLSCTQLARVLFIILTLFTSVSYIRFSDILICGMILDLCTVLTFAFLKNIKYSMRYNLSDIYSLILCCVHSVIFFISVLFCSFLPRMLGFELEANSIASIVFLSFVLFPLSFILFSLQNRIKRENLSVVVYFLVSLIICLLVIALLKNLSNVLLLNIGPLTLCFSTIAVLLTHVFISMISNLKINI